MRRRDFIKYLGLGGVAMLAMPQSIRANSSAVAVPSSCKKLKPISGSWFEFRHSASEGGNWNKALTHFTADQWRRKIFEMREIGMEYLVMMGIALDGKPFYPSQIACLLYTSPSPRDTR